jgi:hypothetical protein
MFYYSGLGRDKRDGYNKATNKEDKKISSAKNHFVYSFPCINVRKMGIKYF